MSNKSFLGFHASSMHSIDEAGLLGLDAPKQDERSQKNKIIKKRENFLPLLRGLNVSFLFQAAEFSIGIHNQVIKDFDAQNLTSFH